MSKLILLGGPPGVGKSTALRELETRLTRAAVLDADDVSRISRELVVEEHRYIALTNVIAVMRGFFLAGCELGVLSWVFARSALYDPVIAGLKDVSESVDFLYLVASPDVLEQRLTKRQDLHKLDYAMSRLKLIEALPYTKIDTSDLSSIEVADRLVEEIAKVHSA